jgi:hypothetical protein
MISRRHPRRVYVARGLRTGLYKIGVTRCLIERVRSLAAWLREPVEVMADLPGGLSDERAAHHRFSRYRVTHPVTGRFSRELFSDTDGAIAAWAAALPASTLRSDPPRAIEPAKLASIVEKRRATRLRREATRLLARTEGA